MPAAGTPEAEPQPLKLRTWAWISCGAEDVVTSHSWMNGRQLHYSVPATSPRPARTGVEPGWSSTSPSSHLGPLLPNRTCPLCLPPPLVSGKPGEDGLNHASQSHTMEGKGATITLSLRTLAANV